MLMSSFLSLSLAMSEIIITFVVLFMLRAVRFTVARGGDGGHNSFMLNIVRVFRINLITYLL